MENIKIEAHDHMNNARRCIIEGKTHDALTELKKATTLYKRVYENEPTLLAEYYTKLANILNIKLDMPEDSARYLRLAAEKYLEVGDKENAAYTYYLLGETYDIDLDSMKGAADAFNKATELYLEMDEHSHKAAECLEKLATIYYRAGEYDIVKGALDRSTDIKYAICNHSTKTAEAMHSAAKLCFDMRMLDDAILYMRKALEVYTCIEGDDGANATSVREELKMYKAYKGYDLE